MSPASVLAHGGGDSDAFCDYECDWIDGDRNRARAARYGEVNARHGGGVVLWQEKATLYGYILCCMRETGIRGRQLDEHGLLRARNVELKCSEADNVMHPQCFCLIRAKWPNDRWWTVLMLETASCQVQHMCSTWPRSRPGSCQRRLADEMPWRLPVHAKQFMLLSSQTYH